ncbi:MAG TPA: chromate resistance protein ChrB domain-containing protein [Gemmatimonadaceae bacterium]|nr:chromate resistance protein ChrB domain-containing protein [Gemmatimonadaceae bacterium]
MRTVPSTEQPPEPASPDSDERCPWLLLIHQLPPTPNYLRVKVRRRLRRLGAVALKQTVYVLPNTDEALEDLQWLRQEIDSAGGSAIIAESRFVEGISDEEIAAALAGERADSSTTNVQPSPDHVSPGRTWVTRADVHVDRIASAWLIRRFIDPKARFKFVPARGYTPRRGELRFDMTGAEYTHVAEDCTFQTLVKRFHLREPALVALGEIVHDIDCKDEAFKRPETSGIQSLVRGIVRTTTDDLARIERGAAMLDDLYQSFARK